MNRTETASPQEVERAADRLARLEASVALALVGQRRVVRESIVALAAAGHVLLEGVPGVGKTLLVRALAAALGGRFSRIQFTPDLMPSDVTGHAMFDLKSEEFRIRRGPLFCNLLLGDEINRAPAKTQSAMLEAMQEQQVTIEGKALPLPSPFLVFATQNPIEQEGTYPLPQAQLDRFLLKVFIDYPEVEDELALVRASTQGKVGDRLDTSGVEQVCDPEDLLDLQGIAARLRMDESLLDYAVRLVRAARDWQGIETGPGPRASVALVRAARGHALLAGNGFVTPDDVKLMAPSVLRHRLKLTADLEIEGYRPDEVLADLVAGIPAPRV
ncbi:ATPase associated with various cellular activities AAA_3 [Thiorhodococcus drewsii AZ1]|uniref:ATPase associated with various cellular activities AAA_3 n=1 Tax=Thiorhodococcus drewsii AZ1 TaxID=765913 RepID=G2E682_9GAMM|nr:MoxR family ATPase [Thiorhodococcus drewsii]EGV28430.1 ATPase associated with various cellular activities AAA_3 [Thiorhodococcus drewsii AZ1]